MKVYDIRTFHLPPHFCLTSGIYYPHAGLSRDRRRLRLRRIERHDAMLICLSIRRRRIGTQPRGMFRHPHHRPGGAPTGKMLNNMEYFISFHGCFLLF